jgi:hypothetical protein
LCSTAVRQLSNKAWDNQPPEILQRVLEELNKKTDHDGEEVIVRFFSLFKVANI